MRLTKYYVLDLLREAEELAAYAEISRHPLSWAYAALAWFRYDRAWAQYDYEGRRGGF